MRNIGVSIVVPVFNAEKYLNEFLESVYNQTFNNFELIMVNDGSDDSSEEIILDFKRKYSNLIYLKQNNMGQSQARNLGIKYIKGQYTIFLDADDYLEPNMIEKLYNKAEKNNADMVICGYRVFNDYSGENETLKLNIDNEKVYTSLEAIKMVMKFKIQGYLWNKMILTDNIINNNISFEQGRIVEDLFPVVKLINSSKNIVFVNEALYNYRKNLSSTLQLNRNIKLLNDRIHAYKLVCNLISSRSDIDIGEYYKFISDIQYQQIEYYIDYGLKYNSGIYDDYRVQNYNLIKVIICFHIDLKTKIKLLLFKFRKLHHMIRYNKWKWAKFAINK